METEEEKAARLLAEAEAASQNQNPNPSPDSPPATSNLNVDTTQTQNQLFMTALREREQEVNRLQRELEAARQTPQTPQTPEEQWNNFTTDPRKMMRDEINASVAPLNQFIANFQRNDNLTKLKNVFRNQPQYAPIFTHAEAHLDNFLSSVPNVDMQSMQLALLAVGGAIATGQIQIPGFAFGGTSPQIGNNNPQPNNEPRSPVIPPNTPRSTPVLPVVPIAGKVTRELTETEKRLARSAKMTEDEYRAGLSDAPLSVPNLKPKK